MKVIDKAQVSGYPSNTIAVNLSKDTCQKEFYNVEGIDEEIYKMQNINLLYGKVNAIEYCTKMLNFPTLKELDKSYLKSKE